MKTLFTFTLSILLLGLTSSDSYADWLIFHKPAYKGKVIDIDTKEPIEGAVVVAIYHKYPIISGPAGGSSTVINVREALTDKEGKFQISSYMTLIAPLSESDDTLFIIFKPGYAYIGALNLETYFTGKEEKDQEGIFPENQRIVLKADGSIELPKLKSIEERKKSGLHDIPSEISGGVPDANIPELLKAVNEERRYLGLTPFRLK